MVEVWWRCGAFAAERAKLCAEHRVRQEQLPRCLAAHGIAPELAVDAPKAFWRTAPDAAALEAWAGALQWRVHVPRWAGGVAGLSACTMGVTRGIRATLKCRVC